MREGNGERGREGGSERGYQYTSELEGKCSTCNMIVT